MLFSKRPPYRFIQCRTGEQGVALILVLAFIVLISILIVSFIAFTQTNRYSTASYAKSIQAQEVAFGGIQDIITDLRQEIAAGSRAGGYTISGKIAYVPSTNYTAQPARLGYIAASFTNDVVANMLPPTLVRVSRASQDATPADFYPPLTNSYYISSSIPTNRASAANSSSPSLNGRYISPSRWNKPALLSTNSTIPSPFANNPPDWVYVTRSGSRAITTNDLTGSPGVKYSGQITSTNAVVGRYAYVIYDEGALLDINTAGYLSSNVVSFTTMTNGYTSVAPTNSYVNPTTKVSQVYTAKTYSTYADLTKLPGLSGNQSIIDTFIKWRNGSLSLTGAGAATNYYQGVANYATNGFLSFQPSDNVLISRQDLLNYVAKVDPNKTSLGQALPYLGTFSRASTAPSWHPTADSPNLPGYAGTSYTGSWSYTTGTAPNQVVHSGTTTYNFSSASPVNYLSDSETSGKINRDIANVRFTASATVTHYNDDGTTYTYNVNAGDPLVQHRFSLAKLAWLTSQGPANGISAQAIQDCFGLQWDPQDFTSIPMHYDRWRYVAGTTSPVSIKTLDQVAAEGREPNFFELLKAGILTGSLGQSPGPLDTGSTSEGISATGFDQFGVEKNRHILQIGANIIDQADTDSIPTAIYLGMFGAVSPATSLTTGDDLYINTVYGDENLPGLTMLTQMVVEDWYDTTAKVGSWKDFIIPQLWNIHQTPPLGLTLNAASNGSPGYPRPTKFRIRAYGTVVISNNQNGSHPSGYGTNTGLPMNFDDTTTSYTYRDGTTVPNMSAASLPVPAPTGAVSTITGGRSPSVAPDLTKLDVNSAAGLVYFIDTPSAASAFYRYPSILQSANLYPVISGDATIPFRGTHPINLAVGNYDASIAADYTVSGTPAVATIKNNLYVGLFAGSDEAFPDWSTVTSNQPATLLSSSNTASDVRVKGGPSTFVQYNLTPSTPLTISVECQDPVTSKWHPYNFIGRLMSRLGDNTSTYYVDSHTTYTDPTSGTTYEVWKGQNYYGTPGTTAGRAWNGYTYLAGRGGLWIRADPRTDRFSVCVDRLAQGLSGRLNISLYPQPGAIYHAEDNFPMRSWGFAYVPDVGDNPQGFGSNSQPIQLTDYAVNSTSGDYYVDPDGVVRPGDSYRVEGTSSTGSRASGDGCPTYSGTGGANPSTADSAWTPGTTPSALTPTSAASAGGSPDTGFAYGSGQARRPVILNRPFRNVGELGYTFRDLPFKSLDFFSSMSADAALLDLFSVSDDPTVVAGQVNLSNTPQSTLQALLSGASKMEINNSVNNSKSWGAINATTGSPNFITPTDAQSAATAISNFIYNNGPITDRSELVTKLSDSIFASLYPTAPASASNANINYANKAYAEAPVRALSNVTSTRTWNLLIDIIAQTGEFPATATSLNDFTVQGERRYWLHIAIDRYTGKILDSQLEPVHE